MSKRTQGLKALHDIALDHCHDGHPDLAAMARDLGRAVHQQTHALGDGLADLRARSRGFERWLLGKRRGMSVLLMAWPANHITPVHDHAGLWGLELVLHGALEVQSYTREPSGQLRMEGRDWLGLGDASWFDADHSYVHRCRNLSRHQTALSLHVYGGDLAKYFAYEQSESSGHWIAKPQRSALAGQLTP